MLCLYYIINILLYGINLGENIDFMVDEVKKNW